MKLRKGKGLTISTAEDKARPLKATPVDRYWDNDYQVPLLEQTADTYPHVRFQLGDTLDDIEFAEFSTLNKLGVETISRSQNWLRTTIPQAEVERIESELAKIHALAEDPHIPGARRDFFRNFMLPDPAKLPEAWRISGFFRKKLHIIWGYCGGDDSAVFLPQSTVSRQWSDASARIRVGDALKSRVNPRWMGSWTKLSWILLLLLLLGSLLAGCWLWQYLTDPRRIDFQIRDRIEFNPNPSHAYVWLWVEPERKVDFRVSDWQISGYRPEEIRDVAARYHLPNREEDYLVKATIRFPGKPYAKILERRLRVSKAIAKPAGSSVVIKDYEHEPDCTCPICTGLYFDITVTPKENAAGLYLLQLYDKKALKPANVKWEVNSRKLDGRSDNPYILEQQLSPGNDYRVSVSGDLGTRKGRLLARRSILLLVTCPHGKSRTECEQCNGAAPPPPSPNGPGASPGVGTPPGPPSGSGNSSGTSTPSSSGASAPSSSGSGTPSPSGAGTPSPGSSTPSPSGSGTPSPGSSTPSPSGSGTPSPSGASTSGSPQQSGTGGGIETPAAPPEPEKTIADYPFQVVLSNTRRETEDAAFVTFAVTPVDDQYKGKYSVRDWKVNQQIKLNGEHRDFTPEDGLSFAKRYTIDVSVSIDGRPQKVMPYQWNCIDAPVWKIVRDNDTTYNVICTNSSNVAFSVENWKKPEFISGEGERPLKFADVKMTPGGKNKMELKWNIGNFNGVYFLELTADIKATARGKALTARRTDRFEFMHGSVDAALAGAKYTLAKQKIYFCQVSDGQGRQWNGTAFAITDKYLLTNYHVAVGGIPELYQGHDNYAAKGLLQLSNEHSSGVIYARVVNSNRAGDIALLRICDVAGNDDERKLPDYFVVAESGDLAGVAAKKPLRVMAVGYPSGTVRLGAPDVVIGDADSLYRDPQTGVENVGHFAPIQPGYSGGPLISVATGKIVGVNRGGLIVPGDGEILQAQRMATSIGEVRKAFPEAFSTDSIK